jgi:hypothetical protein
MLLENEIAKFNPQSSFLTKQPNMNNIEDWMNKFISVYHQLVHELDTSKININVNKIRNNKKTSIELLIDQLFKKGILDYKNDTQQKLPIELLKNLHKIFNTQKKTKKKSDITKISKSLSEWFNKYNNEIYYSNNGKISFINFLRTRTQTDNPDLELVNQLLEHLEKYNMFTSYNIQSELNNGFKYEYSYSDNQLEFKICSNYNIPLDNLYWKFLYARMKCIQRLYKKDTQKIKFKILLTDQLKEMPRKNKLFGPEEVNSGSTDYTEIAIWRKEEHFKVILHESVHFFNLDGTYDLSEQNDNIDLKCHFQIDDNVKTRIYESYTESLAVFLNTFANAYQIFYMNQNDPRNINLAENQLQEIKQIKDKLWIQEKKFFLLQIAKIFININPKSNNFADFLVDTNNCQISRQQNKNKLNQTTSLLSYHIIKGANIIFDQDFLQWLQNPFNPHPKSLYKFADYVIAKTKDPIFINLVNKAIKYLKTPNIKFSNTLKNTLRMTSYETNFF